MTKLDPAIFELATGPNYAALTTLMPDGRPQVQLVWVDADAEHVLVNTEVARQKFRNVQRDSRVSLVVWDKDKPFREAEVRGRVVETVRGEEARAHIDQLAYKYMGGPYTFPIGSERVILKIAPDRQIPPQF